MVKSTIALAVLALGALGLQRGPGTPGGPVTPFDPEVAPLKEQRLSVEYTAARDEAVIVAAAESEVGLARIQVRSPSSKVVVDLRAPDPDQRPLSGFVVEMRESSAGALFATYGEGEYVLRGRTADGRPVRGTAVLSHELLREPAVLYPSDGEQDVPASGLLVSWVADPDAVGYRVVLEQDENAGLAVTLPPESTSFQVPDGVLLDGTETQLEVGVIGRNGNCTLREVLFTTR